jgi:hypothetical protein
MKQPLKNKSFKLSEDEIYYLAVLKEKYKIKVNQFVRKAIVEKLERDVPVIRKEYNRKLKKEYCPF